MQILDRSVATGYLPSGTTSCIILREELIDGVDLKKKESSRIRKMD